MTKHFDQPSCERFAPLISAMIDGELESEALEQLESHLAVCTECQARLETFGEIDELVYAAGVPAQQDLLKVFPADEKPLRKKNHNLRRTMMRWIPLAVAASVLIGFIVIAIPSESTVNAEQIAQPLAELEMITEAQRDDQARMLKTLQLELRMLKLEVGGVADDSDPAEKKRLSEHIDRLIEKVNQFDETGSYQETLF